jgi:hypothetical protein
LQGGVDVRLTVESVKAIKTSLHAHLVVEVTIDPRHDRPYVLPGGLRVVEQEERAVCTPAAANVAGGGQLLQFPALLEEEEVLHPSQNAA